MARIKQNLPLVNGRPRTANTTEIADDFAPDNWRTLSRRARSASGPADQDHAAVVRIVEALGGHGSTCHCPAHDDQHASLSVTVRDGKLLVHCHAPYCSQAAVIAALKARGLWPDSAPSLRPQQAAAAVVAERQAAAEADKRRRRELALAIIDAAHDAPEMLQPYLRGRGIDWLPRDGLWLPRSAVGSLKQQYHGLFWLPRFPAMVLPIIRADATVGAHVTLLSCDATTKLGCDLPRRMFGPMKGGYVVLDHHDAKDLLVIGEGVENAMSYVQLHNIYATTIAALSATNMPDLGLPLSAESSLPPTMI